MNDDEPAVVSCACHLALVLLQERRGASAPWELVEVLLRNSPEENRPSREEAGATASASLTDAIAKVPGLTQGQVFSLLCLLFYAAYRAMALTRDETERLVREAEDLAIALEFSPPLLRS